MSTQSSIITPELLASAYTYEQYVALSNELLAQSRTTSEAPSYNTPEILGYAKLNIHRMNRLDKLTALTTELKAALAGIAEPWTWLVLTESWCGDAAQSIPVLHHMAEQSPQVSIRFLLRDKNPDLINAYLTNGGKSIPKLICVRTTDLKELGSWGPRPAQLQVLFTEWQNKMPFPELAEKLQRWYNDDRTQAIQREFLELITAWRAIR
ncbi:thioredoxin family protein [Spirosoma agri]|uniref:Thioredoxin family protein n=1 Tax=Spirosoma agri TaxID=1987381 RepID=A0A6M0IGM4_9BACT|nr:thioredoxin family protein [Spirosoma agri]NEU67017.1 thioredoxin family protein [Spirosoma agri]